MNFAQKSLFAIAFLSAFISGQPSVAQNSPSQLDKGIQTESNALGGLVKDLGPALGGELNSVAGQMGDPNLSREMRQLPGSATDSMGASTVNEISGLASQISHIPGFGNICSDLQAACSGGSAQFSKPAVSSKLLPQFSNRISSSLGGGSSMLGDVSTISKLLGAGSAGSDPAVQSELGQASQVMPSAVRNLEQENQAINQLLKE